MEIEILENLKAYYPWIYEQLESYSERGIFEIIIHCDDGSIFLYDDRDKTIRALPQDYTNMTEDRWRREFGYKLSKLIFNKGWTQAKLAEKANITQPQLNGYIMGKNVPSFYIVDRIAKALGCSTDDLRYI